MRCIVGLALITAALVGCSGEPPQESRYAPEPYVKVAAPVWSADSTIYQLNTRQFTREGTFAAAQEQLPRLADMGVEIIWLMPIHPIGEEKRKGSLGSPYAVKDYRAVNPDLGTEEEFRAFVEEAHRLGLKVILDWVANHSAWDNPLTTSNPEWYSKNPEGEMMAPEGTDWSDVVDFDYGQIGLREYMTGSLVHWVREFDIDGYRADVAGFVPLDFWETARAELEEIKPVFMLAEWQTRDLHARAFNATYAWGWKEAMQKLVAEGSGAGAMRGYYAGQKTTWPHAAYRMVYTDNHDQNSWDGVASDIYGPAYETAIALSFTGPGIPLIYNGQEADLDHQLAFFEKDEIEWKEGKYNDLLKRLVALKKSQPALWNGKHGAPMIEVPNTASEDVLSFVRGENRFEGSTRVNERIFAVFNLSPRPQTVRFETERHLGSYVEAFAEGPTQIVEIRSDTELELAPWEYRILTSN